MKKTIGIVMVCAVLALILSGPAQAAIFFEDFNNQGSADSSQAPWVNNEFGTYIRNFGTDDYGGDINDGFTQFNVTAGTVDLFEESSTFGPSPGGQGRFVDLAGSNQSDPLGQLTSIAIPLTQSGPYRLSFMLAGNNRGDVSDTVTVEVQVSGLGTWLIESGTDLAWDDGWTLFSDVFDISASSVNIVFTSGGVADKAGFLLDDVKLEFVPIPGAAILFSSGLVGLICLRRRVR